jgi:hypothetical protein
MRYLPIVIEPQPARTIPRTGEGIFVWLEGSNMPTTARFHRIGFRRVWDNSVVHEDEITAWARIPNLNKAVVPNGGQSDFERGISAAAKQLEDTAADYEEMGTRIKLAPNELGGRAKMEEKRLLLEKSVLLKGQATHIRNIKP